MGNEGQTTAYITGGVGLEKHPLIPPSGNVVRGLCGEGGYAITVNKDPQSCTLIWLMDSDLRGWMPRSLVESTLTTVLNSSNATIKKEVASRKKSVKGDSLNIPTKKSMEGNN